MTARPIDSRLGHAVFGAREIDARVCRSIWVSKRNIYGLERAKVFRILTFFKQKKNIIELVKSSKTLR